MKYLLECFTLDQTCGAVKVSTREFYLRTKVWHSVISATVF